MEGPVSQTTNCERVPRRRDARWESTLARRQSVACGSSLHEVAAMEDRNADDQAAEDTGPIFQPNQPDAGEDAHLARQLRLACFQRRVRGVRGLELQLHTGSSEVENPPDANGKSEDEQGDGEELLQRFKVTYKSFRNHESLVRAERNDGERKREGHGGPQESGPACPRLQLKQANAHAKSYRDQERWQQSQAEKCHGVGLVSMPPVVGGQCRQAPKNPAPDHQGRSAAQDGESSGGGDTGGARVGW